MVTRADRAAGRRNAGVVAATGVALGLLFLFPTSLNHLAAPATTSIVAPVVAEDVSAKAGSTATSATTSVDGPAVDTRFGPVQVRLQVANGKVVAATAVDYPQNNRRDIQINTYAVPVLNSEAVDAQNADIDTVSGATYTSVGYRQSLQAALDSAHLA